MITYEKYKLPAKKCIKKEAGLCHEKFCLISGLKLCNESVAKQYIEAEKIRASLKFKGRGSRKLL